MQAFHLDPQLARDSHAVCELRLCSLRLMDDARFPWLILVPRVDGARDIIDLDAADQTLLMAEIARISAVLREVCTPHKLNVAALGNVVAQLHVHVIARFENDAAWPRPVWGTGEAQPYVELVLQPLLDLYRSRLET